MKKFISIILVLILLAGAVVCGVLFIPKKPEEASGPDTNLTYEVTSYGTSCAPTLRGTAKFKFSPEMVTISLNDIENDVKPYTVVYAPVDNEYYYILTFDNVILYDELKAGEYTATLNAYSNGEVAAIEEVSLTVEKDLHYFQHFNNVTGDLRKGMNEDLSDIFISDNYNDKTTEKQYFEKSGMATDGLGQRAYGLVPVEQFSSSVNVNEEGYITYALCAQEGYMINTVNLKSYVTLCHAGSSEDWTKADIKVQVSYDNVNFEDVYSLRADETIVDTWTDGKTYYGEKGAGILNGSLYVKGMIEGMTEVPADVISGVDVRYQIDCEIPVENFKNVVYVRILCLNASATEKPIYAVPTRIHNVMITASQI